MKCANRGLFVGWWWGRGGGGEGWGENGTTRLF